MQPARLVLDAGRQWRLHVFDLGLACCAMEFVAAATDEQLLPHQPGEPDVDVMVVSGTVTDKLAPHVLAAYERMSEPKRVISFGSCANCGGPYWDSYSVTKGVDQLLPVDVYVPGCPPRPEALLDGVRRLAEQEARA